MGEMDKGRRSAWNSVASTLDREPAGAGTKTREAVESIKHAAKDQAAGAKAQIETMADLGKDRVASRLGSVARALKTTGEGVEGAEPLTRYASRIGEEVERAERYLKEHQAIDLLDEIEGFARRQPLLFMGGAFAVGVAIGRFLKSSSAQPSPARSSYQASGSFEGRPSTSDPWSSSPYGSSPYGSASAYGSATPGDTGTTGGPGRTASSSASAATGGFGNGASGYARSTYGDGASSSGAGYGNGQSATPSASPGTSTTPSTTSTTPSTGNGTNRTPGSDGA